VTYADAVMRTADLSVVQAMVALAWAHDSDGSRTCRSYEAVARAAKVHRRTAIRATQRLVEAGWLRPVAAEPNRPTTYALVVPAGHAAPPPPVRPPGDAFVVAALQASRDVVRAVALHDDPAWRADRAEHPHLRALWAAWTADREALERQP
jgi:hypothetical protein